MRKKILCGVAVLTTAALLTNKKKKKSRIKSKYNSRKMRKIAKKSSNSTCDYCEPPCCDEAEDIKDDWMYWC